MNEETRDMLISWADKYNDPQYFREDPIAFPARMAELYRRGERILADIEITALIAAHLAWGRRAMIVRDSIEGMDNGENAQGSGKHIRKGTASRAWTTGR